MKKMTKTITGVIALCVLTVANCLTLAPRALASEASRFSAQDRAYWFYQPLADAAPPRVKQSSWVRNPIDQFVLAKLEASGLTPAPESDRATLVRRAYLDLIGLPPTPQQVDAFVNDPSPQAYEQMIDSLLDSPRYGERMARHWLDLVRYADSDGFKADDYRPLIWKYRDWVIQAFNADMPYDQFVRYQIAGDELTQGTPAQAQGMIATGYLRLWPYEFNQRDVKRQWGDIVNEVTDNIGTVFMGSSMGCARCHDHKFDPILQEDYFKLQAFVAGIFPDDSLKAATPAQQAAYEAQLATWLEATADIREQIEAIEAPHRKAVEHRSYRMFTEDLQALLDARADDLSPYEQQVKDLTFRQLKREHSKMDKRIKGEERKQWEALKAELAKFDELKPKPLEPVMAVRDVARQSPVTTIPQDRSSRGGIQPGWPAVLGQARPQIEPMQASSGRRTALADWLTQPDNAMTTRVIVNRLWQYHFGVGIVATANDFGMQGQQPTHPQLLDWLAQAFVAQGWSLKRMHKLIMMSAAYRQSATAPASERAATADPDNKLLWRQRVRRLDAEQIRDAMLVTAGVLDNKMGGPGVGDTTHRRSIYLKFMRNNRPIMLETFDGNDGFNSCAKRNVTTTSPQALLMLNGDWSNSLARQLAESVRKKAGSGDKTLSPGELVEAAYRRVLGRAPSDRELDGAIGFLNEQTKLITEAGGEGSEQDEHKARRDAVAAYLASDQRNSDAAWVNIQQKGRLFAADSASLSFDDTFTIEATFLLRENDRKGASVRVIAGQWDGNTRKPGWSLGVTGVKSRYTPQSLIFQFIGKNGKGQIKYEVVESKLVPQFNRVYHVAASVKLSDTGKTGVTFYLRDLTDSAKGELQTAQATHEVVGGIDTDVPVGVGGRWKQDHQGWDGLLDNVRLYNAALKYEQLLGSRGAFAEVAASDARAATASLVADWRFEKDAGFERDLSPHGNHLDNHGAAVWSAHQDQPQAPARAIAGIHPEAIVDFCHVLMNSNEFVFVD